MTSPPRPLPGLTWDLPKAIYCTLKPLALSFICTSTEMNTTEYCKTIVQYMTYSIISSTALLLSFWAAAQRAASAVGGARAAGACCPAAGAPAAGSAAAQSTGRAAHWRQPPPRTAASGERCCTPPGSDGRADTARLITKENYFLFLQCRVFLFTYFYIFFLKIRALFA
jgi:hypothetical protein